MLAEISMRAPVCFISHRIDCVALGQQGLAQDAVATAGVPTGEVGCNSIGSGY